MGLLDLYTVAGGINAADVAAAHGKDPETQGRYGVNDPSYWVDEQAGKVFCLVETTDVQAASTVHRQAHGLVAHVLYLVSEHS
jgi:hypothetical protein